MQRWLMRRAAPWFLGILMILCLSHAATVGAEPQERWSQIDIYALYQRARPGMSVKAVAALAGRPTRLSADQPVTTWLLWRQSAPGRGTEVLRATFRDGILARIEYESFGDEYQRLIKGDHSILVDPDEMTRLWRRAARVDQAAESCHGALDAFHRLVLGLQERLTTDEQHEWVRALLLRRTAETEFP
jgi:hypothetical protein